MFYSFELQMAGVILLTAMLAGGISLWLKRRKLEKESGESLEHDVSEDIWFCCYFILKIYFWNRLGFFLFTINTHRFW